MFESMITYLIESMAFFRVFCPRNIFFWICVIILYTSISFSQQQATDLIAKAVYISYI